jgi:hypothetical protein
MAASWLSLVDPGWEQMRAHEAWGIRNPERAPPEPRISNPSRTLISPTYLLSATPSYGRLPSRESAVHAQKLRTYITKYVGRINSTY